MFTATSLRFLSASSSAGASASPDASARRCSATVSRTSGWLRWTIVPAGVFSMRMNWAAIALLVPTLAIVPNFSLRSDCRMPPSGIAACTRASELPSATNSLPSAVSSVIDVSSGSFVTNLSARARRSRTRSGVASGAARRGGRRAATRSARATARVAPTPWQRGCSPRQRCSRAARQAPSPRPACPPRSRPRPVASSPPRQCPWRTAPRTTAR